MKTMLTSSKTIVLTGGTSGFGKYVVEKLLEEDVQLFVLARNEEKFDKLKSNLKCNLHVNCNKLHFINADLSDFSSLHRAVGELLSKIEKIDLLILNAGIWSFEEAKTKDGIEETFQVNVLSNYFLIENLYPLMQEVSDSKVIVTASALHQGTLEFENLEFKNNFSGFKAYRQSKLAVITMVKWYARHYKLDKNTLFISQHPGVVNTQLARGANTFMKLFFKWIGTSIEKGASNLLFLTKQENKTLKNGGYYANKNLKKANPKVSEDVNFQDALMLKCKEYMEQLATSIGVDSVDYLAH